MYLGLIGYPVKHSISPAMHKAALKEMGIEGIYLAFEVPPGSLEDAVRGAKALDFVGLNVTIPYKEEVAKLVSLKGDAAKIGVVNTIDLRSMVGYNTDVYGVKKALEGFELENAVALVVGAGGAGKAAALALLKMGAKVVITNRTASRGLEAAELLRKYGECLFYPYERLSELGGKVDLIVNATPLGMRGFAEALPVPEEIVRDVVVFDTVYNPPETPLIRIARERGCETVSGVEMLVYQGAKALEIWTGKRAPVDVMRRAALEALLKTP
ncbi:MAG: shikimate dehydrogenase [Archaeoglobaceae archaeon]